MFWRLLKRQINGRKVDLVGDIKRLNVPFDTVSNQKREKWNCAGTDCSLLASVCKSQSAISVADSL
jgi:hypothetical protein